MKYVNVAVTTQPLTNVALIGQKINSSLRQNYSLMCSGGWWRYKLDRALGWTTSCVVQK
jgi:hypothetical protein